MISGKTFPGKKTLVAGALFAALITFLVYLPSLGNGFVNWDDFTYITQNTRIRSLDLRYILTGVTVSNWHPLTMLSFTADYRLWGLDPAGYHLTNIILHALNTLLVFVLAVRLCHGGSPKKVFYAALSASLLFGLHPIHVESVSWVSERKDVLYAFFYILSVLLYLAYARRSSRGTFFYLGALFSFTLSLMSKSMAVTLPLVLLILDFYPLGRLSRETRPGPWRVISEKIPFFLLSAFTGIMALWSQGKGEAVIPLEDLSVLRRIDIVFRGFSFYIYKIILPVEFAPFYPRPLPEEALNYLFWLSLFVFIAITALAVVLRKRDKVFAAAWLYYVITLVPVIGIVQVGAQAVADRYAYLPGLGILILAGAFTGRFIERYGRIAIALSLAIWAPVLFALSMKTVEQERVWKDSITLWTHEIRLYPERVLLAYLNRGVAYGAEGDLLKAFSDFDRAVELRPFMPDGYYLRASVYSSLGMRGKAIEDLTKAIGLDPAFKDPYNRRGVEYASSGEYGLAIEDFKRAAEVNPRLGKAYANMGLAYLELGDAEKAKESLEKARALGVERPMDYLK